MGILSRLRSVARENDFVEVGQCQDGTTSWFSKASVNMRLCVDGVTNSATVFWASGPGQLASKTFRTVTSLRDWFALKAVERTPLAPRKMTDVLAAHEGANSIPPLWQPWSAVKDLISSDAIGDSGGGILEIDPYRVGQTAHQGIPAAVDGEARNGDGR